MSIVDSFQGWWVLNSGLKSLYNLGQSAKTSLKMGSRLSELSGLSFLVQVQGV